jgi:hypothetical protein
MTSFIKCTMAAMATASFVMAAMAKDGANTWLGRPWEYSYFIKVDSARGLEIERKIGKAKLAKANPESVQLPASVFNWQAFPPNGEAQQVDLSRVAVAVMQIQFDKQGRVLTPYQWKSGLAGHINRINEVVLALGDHDGELQFGLGNWYTGSSSDEAIYVPAICTLFDLNERYKKSFDINSSVNGNFGCREWGFYLQSPDHPYIDVTSYQKQGMSIRPFIGWGRFDIQPKPVIGKMGDTWLCLHDCPDKELPGVIADIRAWTAKHGWPMPQRPKKMPIFPDHQRKAGGFVD